MLTIENVEKIKGRTIVVNSKVILFSDVSTYGDPWYEYNIHLSCNKKYIGNVHIDRLKRVDFEGNPKYNVNARIDGHNSYARAVMGINELKDISALKRTMILLLEQLGFK